MTGFWVMALEMGGMLILTAGIFAVFGWIWRERGSRKTESDLKGRLDRALIRVDELEGEKERLSASADPVPMAGKETDLSGGSGERLDLLESELKEAHARQRTLERDLLRLRDEREQERAANLGLRRELEGLSSTARSGPEGGMDPDSHPHLMPGFENWERMKREGASEEELDRWMQTLDRGRSGEDDLTRLRGVGPVLAERMRDFGVVNWSQIAAWSARDLEFFDRLLKLRGRAERDHWQDQARELAAGEGS